MPKLNKKMTKQVKEAEIRDPGSGSFEPIPAGKYLATLVGVEERDNAFGEKSWSAEFTDLINIRTGETAPGRQWFNMDLPNETMPDDYEPRKVKKGQTRQEAWDALQQVRASQIHAFFEALGYEVDSDTDEMIDEKAILVVGIRTIQSGTRKGERTNFVRGILAVPDDLDIDALGDGDEDDDF